MRLILLILLNILGFLAFGQQQAILFSDAIQPHLKKYNIQSDIEFEKGDIERGQFLFDSLVKNYLVGSRFDDYTLKNVNGRKVKLSKIKKPIYVITYASWCVIDKGEIPALNKLSKKYAKKVQFVVICWDKKRKAKGLAKKFSSNIKVCFANESYRNDSKVVSVLKHTLGFPTSYFLNEKLEVVDIKRGGAQTGPKSNYLKSYKANYDLFDIRITDCLLKKDIIQESQLAAVED